MARWNHIMLLSFVTMILSFGQTKYQNSTSYARPISLTRAPEERDVHAVELKLSCEVISNEYQTTLVQDDVTMKVNCKTECSMLDGKMVSLQQGDRGALILNEEDRENYSMFLSLTNTLTVTQSVNTEKVRIDAVKSLGIELMLHMKNAFINEKGQSWVMIIPSFHQMCAHS